MSILCVLILSLAMSISMASICSGDNQVYLFPAFGAITFIDFDQELRADLARQSKVSRVKNQLIPPPMKKSIALGRAGFRPGKRAEEVPFLLETGNQPLVVVKH